MLLDAWKAVAAEVSTPSDLQRFAMQVWSADHDYNSVAESAAALMLAAFRVADHGPHGGMTGFQAAWVAERVRTLLLRP